MFAPAGIDVVVPAAAHRSQPHALYMDELVYGIVRPAGRDLVHAIVADLKDRDGVDGIVLGGTELSLLVDETVVLEVPVLNTTLIDADAAVAVLVG